ncbi:MAG: xanthine dehydrogenase family protein molybdopterin-binding subunit, partial [Rhodospirillaceae bacterium]
MPDQDPQSQTPEFGPGRSVARLEDVRFLTGSGRYVADMDVPGQVHMAVVRSDHAHAQIRAIDISAAAAMDGVLGVHIHADLDADGLGPLPCHAIGPHIAYSVVPPRPVLATDRLRNVGEAVAAIIAETPAQALAAAEAVMVDTEPLAAVVDIGDALAPAALQLWDQAPGNVAFRAEKGDAAATAAAFAGAAHVVELELVNNRVHACPIEPRAGIGQYDAASETFDLICNVQGVHGVRDELADAVFHVAHERIRVSAPDVGGGFGLKNFLYPEWVLLLWAAKRHGRPVKWVAARGEDFTGAVHGRDSRVKARLALDADGNFLALDGEITGNMGAYLSGGGPGVASRAFMTAIGGIYKVPAIHFRAQGVFTNTQCVDAYRGAGKPEANFVTERLIEVAARRLGFDPIELRLRNAIDTFPFETALGQTIDCGRMRANIEDAVAHADRAGFETRRTEAAKEGKLRGLGFACFLETSRGATEEGAEVRFAADGKVEIAVGTESQGQG